jgi:hypothetical protein
MKKYLILALILGSMTSVNAARAVVALAEKAFKIGEEHPDGLRDAYGVGAAIYTKHLYDPHRSFDASEKLPASAKEAVKIGEEYSEDLRDAYGLGDATYTKSLYE